jgi:hypothetical protein
LWSSGGTGHIGEGPKEKLSDLPKKEINVDGVPDDHESRILAARERFLARKGKKWASLSLLMTMRVTFRLLENDILFIKQRKELS